MSKLSSFTIAQTFAFFALTFCACVSAQTTINVGPGQTYTTIQSGINAANTGDTVLVARGTYFENINFNGKAITVTSSGGAATTIIDGSQTAPAVIFSTSETRASVLSGFTIQHGGMFNYTLFVNGGIYLSNSSPTIRDNILTQNNCWTIYANSSAPLIQDNEISATQDPQGHCSFGGGAGVYISNNLNGGPVTNNDTSAMIIGNTIENNVESGLEDAGGNGGAGIAVWGGSPVIMNNIIRNNASPGGSGGAINIDSGQDVVIAQNLIYGNSAGCGGGAIAFAGGYLGPGPNILIANNTIVNNTGQDDGGFSECINISQIYPSPDTYGGSGPSAVFVNNIVSGSATEPAVNCDWFDTPSEATQPIFDHNILYNAGGAFFGSYCIDTSAKYGNISADPQLENAAGNNYQLKSTSPAIDSGNNSVLQSIDQMTGTPLTTDFAGNARVQDATHKGYPIIDMGAYEFSGVVDASPTTIVLTSSAYSGSAGSGYTLTANLVSALGTPTGSATFFLDGQQIGTSTINSSGVATFSNFTMTPGGHSLYAKYSGQGSFTPAVSVIIIVDISPYSTTLNLTSSANPSVLGQSVTFTVTASAADNSIPTPITLTDTTTNTLLSTLTPNSSGIATYATSTLALGNHYLEAAYAGTSTYSSASTTLDQQVVNGSATNTTLTCNPSTFTVGGTSLLSVAVTSATGTPTGSITFTNGTLPLGQSTLLNGDASLTFTSNTTGTYGLIVTYVPTGSFAASSSSCSVTVNGLPTTTTVAISPNPSTYGQPVIFSTHVAPVTPNKSVPTGQVQLTFCRGAQLNIPLDANGNGSVIQPTGTEIAEPVSSCSFTGRYSGDNTFAPSTSAPNAYVVTPSPSTTTILSASPNPAYFTQPVTITVQITGTPSPTANPVTGNPIPPGALQFTGTVQLFDGTTPIASTTATGAQATFTISTLSVGSHILTAAYSNDPNLGNSTSQPVTEVITPAPPADFTFTGPNITFPADHSGTGTLTLTSLNNFTGSVAVACIPPFPPNYACTLQFSSISLTPGLSSTFTYTLHLNTTASTAHAHPFNRSTRITLAALFPFTLLSLIGLARTRRRTTLRTLLALTCLAILTTATTACGPDHFISLDTGTYPITFTATGTNQGTSTPITHTLTVNATITP